MASKLVESAVPPKLARGMALVLGRDLEIRRRMVYRWDCEMTSSRYIYCVGQNNHIVFLKSPVRAIFSDLGIKNFFPDLGY